MGYLHMAQINKCPIACMWQQHCAQFERQTIMWEIPPADSGEYVINPC